jgi:hypothetical protein
MTQTDHAEGAATTLTEACIDLLDRLRHIGPIAEDLAKEPPEGWTAAELASLAWLASMFHTRLLTSARPDVQRGYFTLQADNEGR